MASGLGFVDPRTRLRMLGEDDLAPDGQFSELVNQIVRGLPEALVSVRGWDSRGDAIFQKKAGTGEDVSDYLAAVASLGFNKMAISGDYTLAKTWNLPSTLRWLQLEDGVLRYGTGVDGAYPMLQRAGSVQWMEDLANNTAATSILFGETKFTVADGSRYASGDVIKIGGNSYPAGAPVSNRYGWMRTIRSVVGNVITVDQPFPRAVPDTPRVFKYTLAPSFHLDLDAKSSLAGVGYRAPLVDDEEYLLKFYYARDVRITGAGDIGNHSRSAIMLNDVLRGRFDAFIHDIWDQYSGYGINVCGATYGFEALGRYDRLRHAQTTNTGSPMTLNGVAYGSIGEPEGNVLGGIVTRSTNKAHDTHRLGINNRIRPNAVGCWGGVQIRADGTHVEPGSITGSLASAITVASTVAIAPTIEGVDINGVTGGDGMTIEGPIHARNISIRGVDSSKRAVLFGDKSRGTIDGLQIRDSYRGIRYEGTDTLVTGLDMVGATVPFEDVSPVGSVNMARNKTGHINLPTGRKYVAPAVSAFATGELTAGIVQGVKQVAPPGTIVGIAFKVTTAAAAGGTARVALYSYGPTGLQQKVGVSVAVSTETTGWKTLLFPTALIQRGGIYKMAIMIETAKATFMRGTVVDTLGPVASSLAALESPSMVEQLVLSTPADFPDNWYTGAAAISQPIHLSLVMDL